MKHDVLAALREAKIPDQGPVTFCDGCEKLKRCEKYRGEWYCPMCKAERQP